MVGSVGACGFAVLYCIVIRMILMYLNDFSVINKSMEGFWYGFGLVLELFLVVRMVGY